MTEPRIIEVEAETLQEAREQTKSQIPEGFMLLSERVILDGKPKTVKAFADTIESAFAKEGEIPSNAVIVEKKIISSPAKKVMTVESFDEQNARTQLESRIGKTETIKVLSLTMTLAGKRGFLGIGKKPNQYEAQMLQQAIVEITYKTKAKISAEIGSRKQQFARLDAQKKNWIGWDCDRLIEEFGQPKIRNGSPADEWLGFKVGGCSVTVHVVYGRVTSAEVWSDLR